MNDFKQYLLEEIDAIQFLEFLAEGTGLSLDELKRLIPSDRNRKFLKIRREKGHTGSFIQEVIWNEKKNHIRLIYHIKPTYGTPVKIISSTKTGAIYESDHYEVIFELQDTKEFLGNRKDFLKLSFKEQVETFRNYLTTTKIKVHSNDMSFYWQGAWENLSKKEYSVYPFPADRPYGKQIWSRRHKGKPNAIYITKHLLEAIETVPFLVSKIVKMIRGEEIPPVSQKPIPVPIPPKPETKPEKKIRPIPSNQTVDLSAITKVPAPKNVNIHREVSARLMPAFNLVRNKKDWKLPIDKTIEADQKTIDDVEEAIQYFTGSPPEIKKIGKNLYKVKAAGYYKSMGDFKV